MELLLEKELAEMTIRPYRSILMAAGKV